MTRVITMGMAARKKLLDGATLLNDAVSSTLGPRGNNVAIDYGFETKVIHDGVTVAKAVEAEDETVNLGVRLIREACNKQVDQVGDGTTVVSILAHAIISECLKITATGVNPMSLRSGLEEGTKLLIEEIDRIATPIKTLKELEQVATISAEDKELGDMISGILHKIGKEGVITVEESKSAETYIEHQEGLQFDKGYISPYFVTNADRMEATIENTKILLADRDIVNMSELIPIFEKMIKEKILNIVIIAPDITDSAMRMCAGTKIQGGMNINCVRAPFMGQNQKDFLSDVAILTGATVFTDESDMKIEDATLDNLGEAERITSTKDATLIVGGKGDKELLEDRIDSLRSALERGEGSDFEMLKISERIGKLTSGVAIVKVGGQTEVEMKERKERAEDAVHATRAAMIEGIVPGGETIYMRLIDVLMGSPIKEKDTTARIILRKSLMHPFYKLLSNAGFEPAKYEDKIKNNVGMDVTTGELKDLVKAGIIDPAMVSKAAIRNAVSVAIQIMTTNTTIVDTKRKEDK